MIKFIDLFCGLGGFRLALESLGAKCVFSSDIDKYARDTYKENFGEYPAGDITVIDEKDIPEHDILCAGFPCQPFSIGGKRLGFEDTRGTLFFDVLRILKEKRPAAFFLENVAGLSNHDKGKTMSTIINCLEDIDYIPIFKVINAKDWYCVGFDKRKFPRLTKDYEFPFPEKKKLKYIVDDLMDKYVSADYTVTKTCSENIANHLEQFIKNDRYDKNHILIANEIRKSRCSFRCDGISPCLTAKMGTGGNNIPVVVRENRKFTERECLRIMGYPDSYKIRENFYQSYKQIGNSVVVPIIKEISEEIVKFINKTK